MYAEDILKSIFVEFDLFVCYLYRNFKSNDKNIATKIFFFHLFAIFKN